MKVLISKLDIELRVVPGDPFLPFCQHVQVAIVTCWSSMCAITVCIVIWVTDSACAPWILSDQEIKRSARSERAFRRECSGVCCLLVKQIVVA